MSVIKNQYRETVLIGNCEDSCKWEPTGGRVEWEFRKTDIHGAILLKPFLIMYIKREFKCPDCNYTKTEGKEVITHVEDKLTIPF